MTIHKPPMMNAVALLCALALFACAKKSDDKQGGAKDNKPAPAADTDVKKTAQPEAAKLLATPAATPDNKPKPKPEKAAPPKPGTFLTYNLGLITAVGLNKQRLPQIIEAMKQTRASVACLQEVWDEADYQTIASELAGHYPHSYWKKTDDPSTYESAPCDLKQAVTVQTCANTKCTPGGTSLFECMAEESLCKTDYEALSEDCRLCLSANTDAPTSCAMGSNKARKSSFKGRNGLVLLSWNKIENPTYTEYETHLVNRGVITATVDGRTVQCTHMTSQVDIVPYKQGGTFDSWEAEHKGQVQALDKATDSKSCRVLLGDMNTGPEVAGLTAEMKDNYPNFKANGWITTWDAPQCTFCPDNPLTGVKDSGRWIDHVFIKGCKAGAKLSYSRAFDGEITVKNEGKDIKTRLSDHYGVLVEATGL